MTTIGQRLKESREDQRLTIDKVFEATRIRVQYLQALEEDDLSIMPSAVQARGYLRITSANEAQAASFSPSAASE